MNSKEITDDELEALLKSQKSSGKPVKYSSLEEHREIIAKAMDRGLSLPVLLTWLKTNRNVDVGLHTLRKYVVRAFGRNIYEEYLKRNHWEKPNQARKQKVTDSKDAVTETISTQKPAVKIDFERNKPATFQRTQRT